MLILLCKFMCHELHCDVCKKASLTSFYFFTTDLHASQQKSNRFFFSSFRLANCEILVILFSLKWHLSHFNYDHFCDISAFVLLICAFATLLSETQSSLVNKSEFLLLSVPLLRKLIWLVPWKVSQGLDISSVSWVALITWK